MFLDLRRSLGRGRTFARLLGDEGAGNWNDIMARIRRQTRRAVYSPVTGKRFA